MKRLLRLLLFLSLGGMACPADGAADLARATLVVYNRNAPDSVALAYFYAEARQIPDDHLIGVECPTTEEISRQDYDATIAEPLRKIFTERRWWTLRPGTDNHSPSVRENAIRFVALIRGMPLKIAGTPDYPGDEKEANPQTNQNNASVDSELAALAFYSRQISGPANNPYFQSFRPILELNEMPVMLVCRLDAPTAQTVRRMISDGISAEKTGLWGRVYVDGANNISGGLADGDQWLKSVVKDLRQVGIPTVYDTDSALFPAGFPMNDCALYYGWYAGGVTGPFNDPGFVFTPGAIAVHLHSFSANTLRSDTANWVAPLLSKGAAASLGNVYEPYLQLTAHLDLFNDRLLHGFTFAESAYMSQRVISWMNVAVGDPLYRPYAAWMQLEAKREKAPRTDWRMYHDFASKNTRREQGDYLATARKAASRAKNGPMIEDLGLSERESGNFSSAISLLAQARSFYTKSDDILRTYVEQAAALLESGNKKSALALIRSVPRLAPEAPALTLLRKMEQELNPPPPRPTPSP
ncbi:MAG: TIGR03790 family protein [Chthoniobacterales bacterium]|nr:TIGR03790 family protein [Chthoniobacterales bacterium]